MAVLMLALGISVNTTISTLFNAVALRPFPVKNPESIANLFRRVHNAPTDARFSYPDYLDYRDHKNVFSDLIASSWVRLGLASSPLSDASGASASPVLLLASTACLDIGLVFYYGAVRSAMTTKE